MPLFFFASGYLHKSTNNIENTIFKKVKGLLIPYAIYVFYNCIIKFVSFILGKLGMDLLSEISSKLTFGGLWFIVTLFFVTLLFYAIEKYTKTFWSTGIVVAFVYLMGFIASLTKTFDTIVLNVCMGLSFYCSGYCFKIRAESFIRINKQMFSGIIGIILCIITCITATIFPVVNMSVNKYGNIIMFYIIGMLGTLSCYYIAKFLSKSKTLQFFGRNSLIIMITHFMVYKLIYMVFPLENASYLVYPLYLLATLFVCAGFSVIVNKYLKFLLGNFKFLKN